MELRFDFEKCGLPRGKTQSHRAWPETASSYLSIALFLVHSDRADGSLSVINCRPDYLAFAILMLTKLIHSRAKVNNRL
jgi:hypothetical protein